MSEMHTASATTTAGVNAMALQRFVRRIEQKHDTRKELNDEIKEIYGEVKAAGMDPATVRQMVKERKLAPEVRADQYRLRDEYRAALGLYADTPLGEAAMQRAAAEEAPLGADPLKPQTTKMNGARKPFASQPVHSPRRGRGRPRKDGTDALAAARKHLGSEHGDDLPPAA